MQTKAVYISYPWNLSPPSLRKYNRKNKQSKDCDEREYGETIKINLVFLNKSIRYLVQQQHSCTEADLSPIHVCITNYSNHCDLNWTIYYFQLD